MKLINNTSVKVSFILLIFGSNFYLSFDSYKSKMYSIFSSFHTFHKY